MAFEAILSQQRAAPSRWRRITLTFSVFVHAVALAAGIVHSLWQVEEMPMPAIEVTLAMAPPPPPPPPPPPKRSSKPKTKPTESKPKTLVAPKEVPVAEPEPAEEEAEEDEGEEGGVEGGVAGGVIGGVVGAAPPPPPKSTGPKLLNQGTGHKLLAINPTVRPYRVNVPEEIMDRADSFRTVIQICVSAQGAVTSVKIIKPSNPMIDAQIPKVIPRWKYKPYMLDGVATPFCYPLRYTVTGS
jgi:periplasmic protein TonB